MAATGSQRNDCPSQESEKRPQAGHADEPGPCWSLEEASWHGRERERERNKQRRRVEEDLIHTADFVRGILGPDKGDRRNDLTEEVGRKKQLGRKTTDEEEVENSGGAQGEEEAEEMGGGRRARPLSHPRP
eukprot:767009-Hanusia_phi.AAC.7